MVFYTLPNKEAAPILTQPHKQYKTICKYGQAIYLPIQKCRKMF